MAFYSKCDTEIVEAATSDKLEGTLLPNKLMAVASARNCGIGYGTVHFIAGLNVPKPMNATT